MSIDEVLAKLEAQTQRLDQLERAQRDLADERDQYKALYQQMLERYRKLERGMLGQKSERVLGGETVLSSAMLEMLLGERAAAEVDALAAQAEAEVEEVRGHTRRKPTGRKALPEHLPRVEIELLPDEVKREGTDAFERIGEEAVETLERRPASMVVVRTVRSKWKRKQREHTDDGKVEMLIAEVPELPIPRGLAGPGMLADTIVRRWQDHMPANRLEDMYRREGVELARSTICSWHDQLTPLGETLISAMRTDSFEQPYLCTDATGVLVQAKEQCRRGHFFVVIAPGKHVLFEYTREHTSAAVDGILAGYSGYLVADAHVVYDHLYESAGGPLVEVNCWAHSRRYFFKAMGSDPERAKIALKMIGALFRVERSIVDKPRKERERLRDKHSKPLVERFFSWCEEQWPLLLESTPIYDGVRYARNQRTGLSRFLRDGRLPLDNNISERELRRQAVGRKNWLFVGSDDGARSNAVFTSLLASCRMHDVEPWSYLRDLLCLLPSHPKHRVLELAPAYWRSTCERPDIQQRLEHNHYRAATLRMQP